MSDEYVKKPMITWAENMSFQIPLSDWQTLWKTKTFEINCFIEKNVTKCFTDCTSFKVSKNL